MVSLFTSIRTAICTLGLVAGIGAASPSMAAFQTGEYKLPASFDSKVTTSLATELWARVWRPTTAGPFPLIVILHGNHGTCGRMSGGIRIDDNSQYTYSGTCPGGYVVTPNHRGYDYLAKKLVNKGYVVVSINANRGVNAAPGVSGDGGLNLRRGRLVLRHLEELSDWNASGGAPGSLGFQITGIIDFDYVGLMGHSRGGEGMRAAVAQYKDPGSPWPGRIGPVSFQSLFEIGPVDGQTSRTLNAKDMAWNVLLPGCDGDVSNLQGIKPLDRMLQITDEVNKHNKSSFLVYGANHNFFNKEWQQSDASSCQGQSPIFPSTKGSKDQRLEAEKTLIPFIRAHVGPSPKSKKAQIFDPSRPLPNKLTEITRHARGFTHSPRADLNLIIDDFDQQTGTSSQGVPNQSSGLSQYSHGSASSNHDSSQRAAAVQWNSSGDFLQVNAAAAGQFIKAKKYGALEFRVMLRCFGSLCSSSPNPTGDTDFSIALVDKDGVLSDPVSLKDVAVVSRPAGRSSLNYIFQTVRIDMEDFPGIDPREFRGVRFTFDKTSSGSIYLGNVRLTIKSAGPGGVADAPPPIQQGRKVRLAQATTPEAPADERNTIASVRSIAPATARERSGMDGPAVEIEVTSNRAFPIGGALPELRIGSETFTLSRFASGEPDRLIFTLTADEFDALDDDDPVAVEVGGAATWNFGRLGR